MTNLQNIQDKFNEVIKHSHEIENPKTDRLIETWYENKKHFIDKWGGLTKEVKKVSIDVDVEKREKEVDAFAFDAQLMLESSEVRNFILTQGQEGIYSNRVEKEYTTSNGKVISKGMKLSKALKFFTENPMMLDKTQTLLSKIIQDSKIEGTLVMSVHPLDFISISDNAHNWRSCHAMDGEYCAGNLSYMQDKHTFVCYLKSEKDQKITNFPFAWNSKKWRVLMFTRPDNKVFMAGKQYPFEHGALLDRTFDLISSVYNEFEWNESWTKPPMEYVRTMMVDELGSMQYNDCLISSTYRPYIRYTKDMNTNLDKELVREDQKMLVGDAIECLKCGCGMASLSSSLLCDECGDYTYCDSCGQAETREELWVLGHDLLCQSCFDDLVAYCDCCDEAFDTRVDELYWDDEANEYICECCHKEREAAKEQEKQDEEACWLGDI